MRILHVLGRAAAVVFSISRRVGVGRGRRGTESSTTFKGRCRTWDALTRRNVVCATRCRQVPAKCLVSIAALVEGSLVDNLGSDRSEEASSSEGRAATAALRRCSYSRASSLSLCFAINTSHTGSSSTRRCWASSICLRNATSTSASVRVLTRAWFPGASNNATPRSAY